VGRTLLSDASDFSESLNLNKINVKSVGQECPTHTDFACLQFPQVRIG